MPSASKTPNANLSQYTGAETQKRADYNQDMLNADTYMGATRGIAEGNAEDLVNAKNSQSYPASRFAVNQKTADDGQDESLWTAALTTLTADTTNRVIGNQALRLTTGASATTNQAAKNNIDLDLTKLQGGGDSLDEDYILIGVLPSNLLAIDFSVVGVEISLGADSTFSSSNRKYHRILSGLNAGVWNWIKVKKSDLLAAGVVDLSTIKSLRVAWQSNAGFSGEYVSFQLIQLVKKDPVGDFPNPFQEFENRIFSINSGEWFVGEEFGGHVIKCLDNVSDIDSLLGEDTFTDFTATANIESAGSNDAGYLSWFTDNDNFIYAQINNNELFLRVMESGVPTDKTIAFDISTGDFANLILIKNGVNVSAVARKNNETDFVEISTLTTLTAGKLAIGTRETPALYSGISITTLSHADTCNTAEVAKSLVEQPIARVRGDVNQSIPNASFEVVQLNNVEFDNFFMLSDGDRLVARKSGYYNISGNILFEVSTTGFRLARILRNGSQILATDNKNAVPTDATRINLSTTMYLNVGDYIQLIAYHTNGSAINILSADPYGNSLSVAKIY